MRNRSKSAGPSRANPRHNLGQCHLRHDPQRHHDGDPDLAGAWVRVRKIHDLKDLRAPEPAELCCFQELLRSRPEGPMVAV
jgi:hypothetical protein